MAGCNFVDCSALLRAHCDADYRSTRCSVPGMPRTTRSSSAKGFALKPGLLELLDWLEAADIPKAVATSTRRERARRKLAQKALLPRIAALVGGDEVARASRPRHLHRGRGAHRSAALACLVLEDSEPGVRAALAAGTMPIMVPDLKPSGRRAARAAAAGAGEPARGQESPRQPACVTLVSRRDAFAFVRYRPNLVHCP